MIPAHETRTADNLGTPPHPWDLGADNFGTVPPPEALPADNFGTALRPERPAADNFDTISSEIEGKCPNCRPKGLPAIQNCENCRARGPKLSKLSAASAVADARKLELCVSEKNHRENCVSAFAAAGENCV